MCSCQNKGRPAREVPERRQPVRREVPQRTPTPTPVVETTADAEVVEVSGSRFRIVLEPIR